MTEEHNKANDSKPRSVSELAKYMNISRNRIYLDVSEGYRFEFPSLKRTTAAHFKAWHRDRANDPKVKADQARLEDETRRLRSASGKAGAQSPKRGSRTAAPVAPGSSHSAQLA